MPVESKPLFRPDIIRPYVAALQFPDAAADNRHLLQKWAELLASENASQFKEQELLPDFLTDIFTAILGYTRPTENPQRYNISREQHVQVDGKFADAALGEFGPDNRRFVIAVEGKGPTDPLDRPFKSRKMSAVDQGYRYAINLPCESLSGNCSFLNPLNIREFAFLRWIEGGFFPWQRSAKRCRWKFNPGKRTPRT